MTQRYFERPTQVAFYDIENEDYICGIAYGEEIICLECGGVVEIEDYLEEVAEVCGDTVKCPIISLEWISLSEECRSDLHFDKLTGEVRDFGEVI